MDNAKLERWASIKEQVKALQTEERELRAEILASAFGPGMFGTQNTMLGNFMVKGTFGVTLSLDQGIEAALECDVLSAGATAAVRYKYEIDKKKYDLLDDDALEELGEYVTVKPSLPTLAIKPVEQDKNGD